MATTVETNGVVLKSAGARRQQKRKITTRTAGEIQMQSMGIFKRRPFFSSLDFSVNRPSESPSCKCLQIEKVDKMAAATGETRIRNIFDVATEMKRTGVMFNSIRFVAYTLQRPRFTPFEDVSPLVLTSPLVVEAIHKTALELRENKQDVEEKLLQRRAERILKKMKASISTTLIKFTGWFLLRFLRIFLRTVQVHRSKMAVVKRASEYGHPMIYLPLHRSHLDYILITFLLWNYDIRAPYVAAGNNMDIPFFNRLMRGLGGFFIRRKLDPEPGRRDHIYRAVLHAYMSELLKKGEGMEFFLEGGRSRSNRPINPKAGLLSVVMDSFLEGSIADAYIVPVCISYEKLIDGHFNREQMGLSKVPESFLGAMSGIFRILFRNYGSVRVDFLQPFSLKEYVSHNTPQLTSSGRSEVNLSEMLDSTAPPTLPPNCPVSLPPSQSRQFIGGRKIVKSLADHVVYFAAHGKALMCTNLVAFLMLTCHREGCKYSELESSFRWLKWELFNRHFDVGFSGLDEDVITYALNLLGPDLVRVREERGEAGRRERRLLPQLSLPTVFELSYQAGPVLTPFLLDSIMAAAIIIEGRISLLAPGGTAELEEGRTVMRETVQMTAKELCQLLADEFIIFPPCQDLEAQLSEVVDRFVTLEILSNPDSDDSRRSKKIVGIYESDEDDDYGDLACFPSLPMKVNLGQAVVRQKLQFYQRVLGPVLEAYLVVCYHATQFFNRDAPEDDFIADTSRLAIERVETEVSFYAESAAMDLLKNGVSTLCRLRVLHAYTEGNVRMLSMNNDQVTQDFLYEVIHMLQDVRG